MPSKMETAHPVTSVLCYGALVLSMDDQKNAVGT